MNRDEALVLLRENVKRENLIKHMLAVEVIMKDMAEFFGEDKEKWVLVGLLHDIDFDRTCNDPKNHALVSAEILDGKVEGEIIRAIKSHNFEHSGTMPESKMEYSLIAADAISGLVIACALVMPSKKLKDVSVESVVRRYKEKDFARNCNRDRIYMCEKIGIDRVKFAEIALKALQSISDSLGL